jgi:hypothetical protein
LLFSTEKDNNNDSEGEREGSSQTAPWAE